MTATTGQLTIDGQPGSIVLPIRGGSVGPDVIDVGALTNRGFFTYDPGFVSTAACESAITYIDGDAGVLMHRGYPIEQLAEHSSHLELCYLLLNGELPSKPQFSESNRNSLDFFIGIHELAANRQKRFERQIRFFHRCHSRN